MAIKPDNQRSNCDKVYMTFDMYKYLSGARGDKDRNIWDEFVNEIRSKWECCISINSTRIHGDRKEFIYFIDTDTKKRVALLVFKNDELEIQRLMYIKGRKPYTVEETYDTISYGDPRFSVEEVIRILKILKDELE